MKVVTSPVVDASRGALTEGEYPLGRKEEAVVVSFLMVSVTGETTLMVWDSCVACVA